MELPNALNAIAGARELHDWFGYWPSFHDAEIISLHLNRRGSSSLLLHTWEMTKEVNEKGFYELAKHVVVEIVMEDVFDLSLQGFSHQNVIFELGFEKIPEGFRLSLGDCYGLSGTIDAKNIALRLTPGKPAEKGKPVNQ